MRFVCLLLAVVSAVLSISYSGAMSVIFGGGSESGALDTGVLCAVIAAFLAIVAVLLLLRKKKLAALPLLIAAGIQTYANLSVETPYPYLLVTVALYAVAGLCSLRVKPKADEEALKTEGSDSEIETETFDDATEAAPVPTEKKPRKKLRCPCSGPCLLLGIILALAAAGVSLHFTGVWQQIYEGGIKLTSLKDFSALDPLTKRVIAAAAFALLATLFHLGRRTLSAILFFISAGILASIQYGLKIEYPHWDAGVILYLLAAFRAGYVGIAAMKNVPPRRYTWAYVYGCLFAIIASLIALSQSGFCPCECVSGGLCAFVDTFVALDCKTQLTLLISALSLLGGVMTFLMAPYASWVLVGTMFLTIAGEAVCAPVFAYSWLTVLLLALAGLCSASSVAIDAPLPVKRLSIAAAIFLMILAALVGSALTLYGTKGVVAEKVTAIEAEVETEKIDAETHATEKIAEPEDESEPVTTESGEGAAEPESETAAENDERVAELENQIVAMMAENEAKIAELEAQVTALTNDSDDQVKYLANQAAAKDEEIANLNAASAENVAKIAELEAQLQAQSSENDAKVAELEAQLQAQTSESDAKIAELEGKLQSQAAEGEKADLTVDTSAKDEEIATLNAAADESAAKIVELEAQIQSLTADRDEQVKNLTVQTVEKDEEIANLNAAADESAEKISALQKQLEEKSQAEAATTVRYIFVHGRSNVRNVPHANAGSKIISRLMDEVAEVFEVVHPEESTGYWYRVEGSFGTGWVFGNANVFPFEVKK